jgi:hypothetical protein
MSSVKSEGQVIMLSGVRLSFPHLIEPQKFTDPETGKVRLSYSCGLLMLPNDPGWAAFMQRYQQLALETWPEHANVIMGQIHADRKSRCYGAGEEVLNNKTMQPYDGYVGMVYINAGRDQPPQVIDATGAAIPADNTMATQHALRAMYAGCRVNAAVKPWIQKGNPAKKVGRGVRCDLVAIQFARDDTAFGDKITDASGLFGASQAPAMQVQQTFGAPAGMPSFAAPAAPAAPAIPGLPPFMMGQ